MKIENVEDLISIMEVEEVKWLKKLYVLDSGLRKYNFPLEFTSARTVEIKSVVSSSLTCYMYMCYNKILELGE